MFFGKTFSGVPFLWLPSPHPRGYRQQAVFMVPQGSQTEHRSNLSKLENPEMEETSLEKHYMVFPNDPTQTSALLIKCGPNGQTSAAEH